MVFKKVLKNLLIFLGILIAAFFILIGCLYFIPNATIFGIKFKKPNKSNQKFTLDSYFEECESITLNLGNVNLNIQPAEDEYREKSSLSFRDDIIGLIKSNKQNPSKERLTCDIKMEDKNLIIDFSAPEGWLFYKDTWATPSICQDWLETKSGNETNNKKLIINTNNAKVAVLTSALDIEFAEHYDTKFSYIEFNSTGKGTFELSDDVGGLKIHSGKGKSTIKGLCDSLNYTTNKGELEFGLIGNLEANAKNSYVHGKLVAGRFNYIGGDGKIDIEQIGAHGAESEIVISGGYIAANINKLFGKVKLDTNKGNVKISNYETLDYYANEIKTGKAKIEVYNINAVKLSLISTKGEIIASASGVGDLTISNNSAKTTFTGQNENGAVFTGTLSVTSGNGEINLNKISSAVSAETTGRGKINAEFTSTKNVSSLKTNKGKVSVKVNIAESLTISAQSAKKKVIVNLQPIGIDMNDKSHAVKTINIGGSDGTNQINIYTAKADIEINQI